MPEHREGDLPASWGDFISAINSWHQYYFAVSFAFVQLGQMIGFAGKAQCSGKVRTATKETPEMLSLIKKNMKLGNILRLSIICVISNK